MSPLESLMAEALFCSDLQPSQEPSVDRVSAAVEWTLLHLGLDECAARVAQECGDHPLESARRMRWCCEQVREAYAHSPV